LYTVLGENIICGTSGENGVFTMVSLGYSTNWRTKPFLEILERRKLIN